MKFNHAEVPCNDADWLQEIDWSTDRLRYHIENPGEKPQGYMRCRQIALGGDVLSKKRIYLDQNYWNYGRDVERGNPQDPAHVRIFTLLKQGVLAGKFLCPASHLILEETLKQTDPVSRDQTARLVQELSTGVAIQPFPVLDATEILHFLASTRNHEIDLYTFSRLAWTYVGNAYCHIAPTFDVFDSATQEAIQKALIDQMSLLEFTTLIKIMDETPAELLHSPADFYGTQNLECERHRDDFRSFEQAYLIELAGQLEVSKPILSECLRQSYSLCTGASKTDVSAAQIEKGERLLANDIYNAFKQHKIGEELPGLRIMAGIHAAIRHKGQKHRRGDRHDHKHARAALPYCDLFITEKSLGHLLTAKPLAYDRLYACRVEWTFEGIEFAIQDLLDKC